MIIRNSFTLAVPADEAWRLLNDIPRVARCAPGAELLEQRADGSFLGAVAVRLGPVALRFKGTFFYRERDEAQHRAVAEAQGNEEKARGAARAVISFKVIGEGDGARVDIDSDLQLVGAIAQYGRGVELIQNTAQVLIDQFAKNLQTQMESGAGGSKTVSGLQTAAKGIWRTLTTSARTGDSAPPKEGTERD